MLNKTGRPEELIDIMKDRKIDIFGLSETKWVGQGRKKLRQGYEVIWSGETKEKRNAVAVIMCQTYAEMVTESESISGRVMKIIILVKEKEMNVLQMYASQTGCSKEEKEEFEEDNANGKYIYIMGDFNAQIRKDRNRYETIMEPHGESNRNRERENLTGHV
jgi:exonuclease III